MNAEIEFGLSRRREPALGVRPDDDPTLALRACGPADEESLAVYVDWDTWNEIQVHAGSDTRIELGGVLLGRACVDREGRPFVMVTGSIPAAHYEATAGSFKFTHESWQDIARQLARVSSSVDMVGWYHTHPGFGIFLSSMDEFICRHFFSSPYDLALVIDPVAELHGWFVWKAQGQLGAAKGFYLLTHRRRAGELLGADEAAEPADQASVADAAIDKTPPILDADEVTVRPPATQPSAGQISRLALWVIGLQMVAIGGLCYALWPFLDWRSAVPRTGQEEPAPHWVSSARDAAALRRAASYRQLLIDVLGFEPEAGRESGESQSGADP